MSVRSYKKESFCEQCGKIPDYPFLLEIDHKLPKALGGTDDHDNLHTLCLFCHKEKTMLVDMPEIRSLVDNKFPPEERKDRIFGIRLPEDKLSAFEKYCTEIGEKKGNLMNYYIDYLLSR